MAVSTAVSELDFFAIKEALKDNLKNNSEFTDHDFDGAGLNVLLDVLAYAAHYTGVYTNLAFSETFLDSAVQRAAVVSRAKELGYVPRSTSAASAIINVSFSVTGNPAQYTLPKNTQFLATAGGTSFTFTTTNDILIENDGNDQFTKEISIVQGAFSTIDYTVDLNDASQRFTLGSLTADTNYLTTAHKDNSGSTAINQYSFIDSLSIGALDQDTLVYFLRETYDGFFEVYFGDGNIGKANLDGNVISLTYLITDGESANGANAFTLSTTLTGISGFSATTISPAIAGADKESVESIKYLAPFYYQSQGRAVTADDYKALIKANYSNVDDISVWGGEENDPPFYGKVFIAIKPKSSEIFSNSVKLLIQEDIISRFNIMSIRPEIVDPEYINVEVDTVVTYNSRLYDGTTNSGLADDIKTNITNFFDSQANKFGQPLYYSKLTTDIDGTSPLILNSITNITLSKSQEIFSGISAQYEYTFNNSVYPGSVKSNEFTIDGVDYSFTDIQDTTDLSVGTIAIFRTTNQGDVVYLTENTGTIDYNSGKISVNNININSIVGDTINKLLTVYISQGAFIDSSNPNVVYKDMNVYTNGREQIVRISPLSGEGITITLLPDGSV